MRASRAFAARFPSPWQGEGQGGSRAKNDALALAARPPYRL